MKEVDHVAIVIGKKPFGEYKVLSKRAFKDDLVTLVHFDNQEYIWIPTWRECGAIVDALFFCENINRVNRGRRELSFYEHLKKMKLQNIKEIKGC